MAVYIELGVRGQTTCEIAIRDLQYPESSYANFDYWLDDVWINSSLSLGTTGEDRLFYTFTGLTPGRTYTFKARANYNSSWYDCGSSIQGTTKPVSAPIGFWTESYIAGSIDIGWSPSEGATYYTYEVHRLDQSLIANGSTASTNATITGLNPGVLYMVRLTAGNSYAESSYTEYSYARSRPTAPILYSGSSTATSVSCRIAVDPATEFTRFTIDLYLAGSFVASQEQYFNDSLVTFSGLSTGVSYEFRAVTYSDAGGYGIASDYVSLNRTTNPTAPGIPTGIVSSSHSPQDIFFNWPDVSTATSYSVELYTGSGILYTTDAFVMSQWAYGSLTSGTLYKARFSAGNSGGFGAFSDYSYIVTRPWTPTLTALGVTGDFLSCTVTINGAFTDASVTLYKAGVQQQVKTITASGDVAFSGLSNSTQYEIRSQARMNISPYEQLSAVSASLFMTTLEPTPVPTNITVTGTTTNSISYDWPDVPTATSYSISIYKNSDGSYVTGGGNATSNYTTSTVLLSGTVYKGAFRASGQGGTSAASAFVYAITKPIAPILSSPIDTTTSAGCWIALTGNFTDASVSLYQGTTLIDTKTVTTNQTVNFTGLTTGLTYKIESQARSYSNPYQSYSIVSNALMIVTGGSRPANWTAFIMTTGTAMPKYNNKPAPVTAASWNAFTVRINEFRIYKSLANYSFTSAVQGQNATAAQVNQARTAILAMSPPTALPSAVTTGTQITATFLKGLQNSLNSIL